MEKTTVFRPYQPKDLPQIAELFRCAVRQTKEYSSAQQEAWIGQKMDLEKWDQSLRQHDTVVAERNGIVAGFGDRDGDYFDRLYVAPAFQRQGIAAAIAARLEEHAWHEGYDRLTVHASLAAQPFFHSRGYELLWHQEIQRGGVWLRNSKMYCERIPTAPKNRAAEISFLHAKPEDASLLVALQDRAFESDFLRYGYCPGYHVDTQAKARRIREGETEAYLIYAGKEPVGGIGFSAQGNGDYFLGCLCIVPEWQGTGIGKKALGFMQEGKKDGRSWHLVTPADKTENICFYQSAGFKITGYEQDKNVRLALLEKRTGGR